MQASRFVFTFRRPIAGQWRERAGFVLRSGVALLPALLIAYLIMIVAWPWSALAPLNPVRGLLDFSEFQYHIRTLLAGQVYEMASVPRLYVPIYILIRVPLLTLVAAGLAMVFMVLPRRLTPLGPAPVDRSRDRDDRPRRDVSARLPGDLPRAGIYRHAAFPVRDPVDRHSRRHRHRTLSISALARWRRIAAAGALAFVAAWYGWNLTLLVELHPYEYLYYNRAVGGLQGASGRYATDYWVNIMPAAVAELEEYLARTEHAEVARSPRKYTVAVCGERLAFEKRPHQRLQWIRMQQWEHADFFIAPTHMNCDRILGGKEIVAIKRMGVTIGVVKDRRATDAARRAPTRRRSALLPRHEVKILPSRRRAVGEGLLLVFRGGPDVVADDVEQFADLDMRLLDVVRHARPRTGCRRRRHRARSRRAWRRRPP